MSGTSAAETGCPLNEEQLQEKLARLSEEIVSDLSAVEPVRGRDLLNNFVSELLLAAAEQRRREEHRRKHSAKIAEAKMNGVRFGRPALPLPDNFDDVHQAWRGGKLTLGQAAASCGMPVATFYSKAIRRERSEDSNK